MATTRTMDAEMVRAAVSTLVARHADEFAMLIGQRTGSEVVVDVDMIQTLKFSPRTLRRDAKVDDAKRLAIVAETDELEQFDIRIAVAVEEVE